MLTSYSTLLKVSDRDIQNLNDQHPDRCQIKQPECILFGQPGSHLLRHFLTPIGMYDLNRIGADRVDLGLPKSTLSAPYLSSFYQCMPIVGKAFRSTSNFSKCSSFLT